MAKPTEEEIQKEIETLRGQVETVRKYTAFGDDNRARIRAQIRVADEDLDEDDIDDLIASEEQDEARYMRYWMDGEEDEAPSESWAPLCKK